jgi:hypothetical protein
MNILKWLFNPEWFTFALGGGGGGGPTSQTSTTTNVPPYLQKYYEDTVGKAQALSNQAYQPYVDAQGNPIERIAGFSPLQQQSFQEAQNLAPAGQLQQGTNLAGAAGLGSLMAGQNYAQQATNPGAVQSYMSPYIQGALNPQLEEARRQSDISGAQNAGQAAKAGAFGGSRFGLQEAERQRNLGTLQNQIYGTGMQNAFQNAQQAQQFGANLGLQGMGQGLQAAQALGQLGQTQFGQEQAAMQARQQAGAQQQALEQQKLQQQYQDFLNQQNWAKNQVNWFSDILHGAPGSTSAQAGYQAPPSLLSQGAGLGMLGYGLGMFGHAKGGVIEDKPAGLAELALMKMSKD